MTSPGLVSCCITGRIAFGECRWMERRTVVSEQRVR